MKLLLALFFLALAPLTMRAATHNICFVTANLPTQPDEANPPEVWKVGLLGLAVTAFLVRKRL